MFGHAWPFCCYLKTLFIFGTQDGKKNDKWGETLFLSLSFANKYRTFGNYLNIMMNIEPVPRKEVALEKRKSGKYYINFPLG